MRLVDWIFVCITAVFGFFIGLIAVQVLQLFQIAGALIALILAASLVAVVAAVWITDRLFYGVMKKVASPQDGPKESKRATIIAFVIGVILAFLATRFWTPEQITGLY